MVTFLGRPAVYVAMIFLVFLEQARCLVETIFSLVLCKDKIAEQSWQLLKYTLLRVQKLSIPQQKKLCRGDR